MPNPETCAVTAEMAELLFAIEAALPFVQAHVGNRTCSSSGGPAALNNLLARYDWERERWNWVYTKFSTGSKR